MFILGPDPWSGSWFFTHPGSRGQKGTESWILDPQHSFENSTANIFWLALSSEIWKKLEPATWKLKRTVNWKLRERLLGEESYVVEQKHLFHIRKGQPNKRCLCFISVRSIYPLSPIRKGTIYIPYMNVYLRIQFMLLISVRRRRFCTEEL
jgi:hypothetical protein